MWPFRSRTPAPTPPAPVAEGGPRFLDQPLGGSREQALTLAQQWRAISKAAAPTLVGAAADSGGKLLGTEIDFEGAAVSSRQFAWYAAQSFIGYQVCAIVAQHWLIDKICSQPAKDAVRRGFSVKLEGASESQVSDMLTAIGKANKRLRITPNMRQYMHMGRVFGIRICIFKVESTDPLYYEKPFNPDAVTPGSYRGMAQVDPYWCMPELDTVSVSDPASGQFYEPTWWMINGKRYHRTHLAIFRNGDVPDLLKPVYQYGSPSVPQQVMQRVYAAERTADEAPELALTKRMLVWTTDVAAVLLNQTEFLQHMANQQTMRDNFLTKINDQGDTMEQLETSLTDLDKLTLVQYHLAAAAGRVPVTKLLGSSPGGFNATGEYDESSYHEELESLQTDSLEPMLDHHLLLVLRSEIEPQFGLGRGTLEATVEWAPLDTPTAKELAETNKAKSDTDNQLVAAGAIDGVDVRNRIANDPDSGYFGLPAIEEPLGVEEPPPEDETDPAAEGDEIAEEEN